MHNSLLLSELISQLQEIQKYLIKDIQTGIAKVQLKNLDHTQEVAFHFIETEERRRKLESLRDQFEELLDEL